jgi:hypothetical protein
MKHIRMNQNNVDIIGKLVIFDIWVWTKTVHLAAGDKNSYLWDCGWFVAAESIILE